MEDRGEVWEVLGGKGLPARRSGAGEGAPKEVNCKYAAAEMEDARHRNTRTSCAARRGGVLVLRLRSTGQVRTGASWFRGKTRSKSWRRQEDLFCGFGWASDAGGHCAQKAVVIQGGRDTRGRWLGKIVRLETGSEEGVESGT